MQMFSRLILFITATLLMVFASAQTSTQNYIHLWDVQSPDIHDPGKLILSTSNDDALQTVQYFDGLGRPIQKINKEYTTTGKDFIQPYSYNLVGLDEFNFSPYKAETNEAEFHESYVSELYNFYSTTFGDINGKSPIEYEKSSLNRVLEKGSPGANWQTGEGNHPIKQYYYCNLKENPLLNVSLWQVIDESCKRSGDYEDNQLFVLQTSDEDGHITYEFKDKLGQMILKRSLLEDSVLVDTYYVYDDYGLLRFVITPEGTAQFQDVFDPSSEFARKYVYCYRYDARKRLIEKQLPGKEPEYYVYNKNDKVIMYQDGNMRKMVNNLPAFEWLFSKYDALGRLIETGITKSFRQSSRDEVQNEANLNEYYFEYIKGVTFVGYTDFYANNTFPTSINSFLTINYFDAYTSVANIPPPPTVTPIYIDHNLSFSVPSSWTRELNVDLIHVTGLNTVTISYFQGLPITSTNYYDDRGRLIQTRTQNHARGYDIKTIAYEKLTNRISFSAHEHSTNIQGIITQIVESNQFSYDAVGRLMNNEYYLNNLPNYKISYVYDDLDHVIQKSIFMGIIPVQSINYSYNIKGWLTQINDPEHINQHGDLFGEKILYNTSDEALSNGAYFNGSISAILWQSAQPNGIEIPDVTGLKAYSFSYDHLNRITSSDFKERLGGVWDDRQKYSEKIGIDHTQNTYDLNGNILGLVRHGLLSPNNAVGIIDNLTYHYCGNKLVAVNDAIEGNNYGDFFDACGYSIPDCDNPDEWEIRYDANGNLFSDKNKAIISIYYDHNNLPIAINTPVDERVEYKYDANGKKLRQLYYVSGRINKATDFFSNFVYENGILSWINTDEGRIVNMGHENFSTQFFLKDHLGNVRVVFRPSGENNIIQQSNSYYPFGMVQKGLTANSTDIVHVNEYLYNGKMFQDEMGLNWLDYGARFYDPVLGRWYSVDPSAEKYESWTPYNYCANNPINSIDPNGEDVYLIIWTTGDGRFGHAAIAVDNYKTVEAKDKNGNTILDKKGNPTYVQVKDGTLSYYDLWPSSTVSGDKEGISKEVPADYHSKTVTMDDIMNSDVSEGEEGAKPDGVIRLKTDYKTDREVKKNLKEYREENKQYSALENNCSDYASVAVDRAIGVSSSFASKERFLYESYTTPNKLFKWTRWVVTVNPNQGNVKKDPGNKVNTTFVGAAKNSR